MRSLLILLALVGVAVARPGLIGLGLGARSLIHAPAAYSSVIAPAAYSTVSHSVAPISYTAVAPAIAPAVAPVVARAPIAYAVPQEISSQYHAQDELGQYSYGYSGGPSAKNEVKTWDGVTRGGYSYVDAEGKVQSVNYISDPVNGFRVAATNLPVGPEAIPAEPLVAPVPVEDTPEVIAAKEAHFAAFAEAKAAAEAAPEEPEPVDEPAADEPAEAAEEPVAAPEEPAPAVVSGDVLPASVLSREVGPIAYTSYAPGLAYGAYGHASYPYTPISTAPYSYSTIAPASYSYSAISPTVAQAPISYSAVAPYSHFAFSSYAPSWYSTPYAHKYYPYSAVSPHSYVPPVSYPTVSPAAAPGVAPISYSPVAPTVAHAPIAYAAPQEISSQYHAQDELGQYSYGYSGGPSAKSEVKTFDGVTRGGYSYVDANGKVQTVNYVADPVNGFRVAATNLPVAPVAPEAPVLSTVPDTPEVAAAKALHLAAIEEAKTKLTAA